MALRPAEAYALLLQRCRETAVVKSIGTLAAWDRSVNLPLQGSEYRAEQLAYLAGATHKMETSPEIDEWLSAIEQSDLVSDPLSDMAVNTREIRREHDRAAKVPQTLVEERTRAESTGEALWMEARAKLDFNIFAPALERHVRLAREVADAIGYGQEHYDALIDGYEPQMTTATAKVILDGLRDELVPFVESISATRKRPDSSILTRQYPIDRQEQLVRLAISVVGFDKTRGRLDKSEHPFCLGVAPGDTRLTTCYNENDFRVGFFGALHEAGHGLYYQGVDAAHFGTPRGSCGHNGLHEAQARLWENAVGHSRSFWKHFFPEARSLFPQALADVAFDDFLFAVNEVSKSFVRVDADEVTYNLHICLRFNIERALIRDELSVADVPHVWNELFESMFGLKVPNDKAGCLQDIHWSWGAFGYFPTYTLGNIFGAQLYETAKATMPEMECAFEQGDFRPLHQWLKENIYQHGQRFRGAELIERVTGEPPSHRPLIKQLKERYGSLYSI